MLRRAQPADDDDVEQPAEDERPGWRDRVRNWVAQHPRDAVALMIAVAGAGAIAGNALFMQTGPHPAPLFALRPAPPEQTIAAGTPAMPRAHPAADSVTEAMLRTPRTRAELVAEIQRGLATRGFYEGAVDGIYGPKTDAAVRDFAQSAQVKLGSEPSEALLKIILDSPVKEAQPVPAASMTRGRRDPIADLIGPSSRVLAVQRALTDFGYGQIKPTGIPGPETIAAIEKFERARRLPVTGLVSERLMRELSAVTGRPLE
jgi:peptidoglycan hydrolase-like protein with peptidoglycan-binding domain